MDDSLDPDAEFDALYDFQKKGKNLVTVRKGEKITILKCNESREWCMVRTKSGKRGWVPSNYIASVDSLDTFCWYRGQISQHASKYLLRSEINGSFLVRESESSLGQWSISVQYEGCVYHYRIGENSHGKVYVNKQYQFSTLAELIRHHSTHADSLVTRLLYPASNRSKPTSYGLSPKPDRWEIERRELVLQEKFGRGHYGDVYKAIWKRHDITVAVKTVNENKMGQDCFHKKALEDFLKEASIMKEMKHPNLIQLFGICTRQLPFYIVTEFIMHGDLQDYLRSNKEDIDSTTLLYMASQIASAMACLERKSIVHRDLAARNCLVGEDNVVKVADFGLARLMKDANYTTLGSELPIKWTAPEGLADCEFSTKSDVWAFGVLLWELFTYGKLPYPGVNSNMTDMYHFLERRHRMERPPGCPVDVYQLMMRCWQWDPTHRPTFHRILQLFED